MRLSPFGLRWIRLLQWWRVVRRGVTAGQIWAMLSSMRGTSDRATVQSNAHKCIRCPLHDRALHRCGNDEVDPDLGCGCFMWYKLVVGGRCWARERDPSSPFGYGS